MSGQRGQKRHSKAETAAKLLAVLFAAELVIGGVHLRALWEEYDAGKAAYEQLSIQAQATPEPTQAQGVAAVPPEPEETPPPWPRVDFEALAEINPDVVGWITIEGTGIDYPIVQGEDDRHYLNYLFTGEKNRAGCVFLDSENAADFSDKNSVVYGHYLNDGTMFSPLLKYKKQDYFDAHPTGWLVTPEGGYLIRFFSGFVSNVQGQAWETAPDDGWAELMAVKSRFSGGPAPQPRDRFITLSTCSYEFSNARFVLLGVLEETI